MAGHSKWSNIKHKKARQDAQRGKIFTKIAREIIVAAKQGGGDPEANAKLKAVIQKAKANNMPNDNINRAIQRGTGEIDGVDYEEIVYEGYGPGGIAILINLTTDNRNRTAGEIRHLFSKNDGNLGETGCVAWMFKRTGVITLKKNDNLDEEELMLIVLDAGAEDMEVQEEVIEVRTEAENMDAVEGELKSAGYEVRSSEITMLPENTIEVTDIEQAKKVLKLFDLLEDHDDVQDVYSNFDISDDVMAELEN
ncbi:YebC/PmpR family DNA-binding regulatory protein [Desulfitispora alkaliphila]|uniref:YebC/PmpR family DNA-binding transcriptional regulator n=1 Tax=Desulfitispora alkaliphila TaxID=622674 RepID=UPI003D204D4F